MYANILFVDTTLPDLENDIQEDGMVENPIVPPKGATVILKGREWFVVGDPEWDYDVFASDREHGHIRVGITIRLTPKRRTDVRSMDTLPD